MEAHCFVVGFYTEKSGSLGGGELAFTCSPGVGFHMEPLREEENPNNLCTTHLTLIKKGTALFKGLFDHQ